MNEKNILAIVVGCLAIIGLYLGWVEYKTYSTEARKYELLLKEKEQENQLKLQQSEEQEAHKLAETERLKAEQLRKETEEKKHAEQLRLKAQAKQKITESLEKIRGAVESFGNGIIEKHDSQTVWTNQIKSASFSATTDSTYVYSYQTGAVKQKRVEILFQLENIANLKRKFIPFDAQKPEKGGYEYLEISTDYHQKDFEYCEYEENTSLCKNRKNIDSFLIFLSGKSMVEKTRTNFIQVKRLHYAETIEELKAYLE